VVITGAVIAVRLVAMPVSIHGMAAGSRLKSVTPFMALYRKQQMEAAKRKDQQAMVAAAQQIKSLQKQFGASPLTLFFPVIFQAAMGIWLFTTLRKMGLEADQIPGFVSEGLPWVPDLGATEYTLPAIVTISGLLTAQVSRTIAPTTANAGPMSPDFMLNMSRFFAVFGGAIMTTLPAVRGHTAGATTARPLSPPSLRAPVTARASSPARPPRLPATPLPLQAVSLSAAVTSMSVMANLTMVRLPAVQKAFGFAKGWPDVEHVVPKGWDKESAARLAAEHAAEESKKNPFAALQNGAADASGDKGEKSAVSFSGVREVAAPPPPEEAKAAGSGAAAATGAAAAASTAAPGTQTTPSGQVLYKARGHKAKKPPAGKPKGKRAGRRK